MLDQAEISGLEDFAREIRKKTLYTIGTLGVGHIGGALSIADILALLYGKEMRYDPADPAMENRDLLVLSKGHAGPALYAALAIKGFFPLDWLDTLNKGGTRLPSHCDRTKTPGIDMTTGSLGQGLSAACGLALGRKIDRKDVHVFAVIGDGESQEGQNWEAAMFAAHYGLSNLIAFTDYNKLQIDGPVDEIMSLSDIEGKWKSFGWHVQRCSGHDFAAMHEAVAAAKAQGKDGKGKPSMIILDTIKGKGAAFCEGKVENHNMPVSIETARQAIAELG
ncbi:transketolase [Breznakiella homolactica]|uniref:Transketolase n=1 Tax=Breznakiella homolactica TaxID=2798577 RepID=A0A7T8BAH3_9SPIR|nr:transketolase [Breznakiella homolactica]QQO09512.1 transketolase [Breznakiella homolactica]